jgi:dTDP-D-glucose 4,6-dehydratase
MALQAAVGESDNLGRLESGLAATVDWYLADEPWWSALLQRT